jgi:hypothetical protein
LLATIAVFSLRAPQILEDALFSQIIRSRTFRRTGAIAGGAIAALVIAATPAFAHFCYREFNSEAAANAAKSGSWITAEEWLDFLPEIAPFLPEGCEEALVEELNSEDSANRLYMGPGLLAGGTLKNGKGNTPENVGYLIAIPECAEAEG